ncbi:MAG: molybdenum cofactor biosynthesis protein A [Bacteroidia bacterium]|jgi:molybdenum cofactor biosynthesis protein A
MLLDSHGRRHNYLRLAITDRCNLRCHYCMPECGIDFVGRKDLLSYEEMLHLIQLFSELGVNKLRLTGGEPFARKGFMEFTEAIHQQGAISDWHLTTNGTHTLPHISALINAGCKSVNISLDTLNAARFVAITKFDYLEAVLESIDAFLLHNIPVKLNMVVMNGINSDEIIDMAKLAEKKHLTVRFLEEMPFNGSDETRETLNHLDIERELFKHLDISNKEPFKFASTSQDYTVKNWKGKLGIIASYTRTFCGSCNRLRVTPTGQMKTCLYSNNHLDLRKMLRDESSDVKIKEAIKFAVSGKARDGKEAEQRRMGEGITESMATIGG